MKLLRTLLLILIAFFAVTSCDLTKIEDAVDNFSIVIGLEPINTSATVVITDAVTGELVNAKVETVFSGANGSDVIDMYSDPLQQAEVDNGVLNFGLSNDVEADENNPATVSLRMSAPGYLSVTRNVEISQVGDNAFTVSMIKRDNRPSGVELSDGSAGTTDENGVTSEDVTVTISSTSTATNEETGASVNIASGSVFIGSDGTPLTGTLRSEAVFYNADEPAAVSAVQGELLANSGDSVATMLGAVDISIKDSNGIEATSIQTSGSSAGKAGSDTGSYIVNFILNANTYSELTQVLRLAYISPTTAERFIIYTVPEVQELDNGRVELRYLLNSNIFRSMALVYFSEQPCNTGLTINRNGNEGTFGYEVFERGFYRSGDLQANSDRITLKNVTRGTKLVRFKLPHTTVEQSIDLCGTGNPTIELPSPPPALIDSEISATLSCTNPSEKVRVTDIPAASILYRESNHSPGTPWRVASNLTWNYDEGTQALTGGSFTATGVETGTEYVFGVTYDNNFEKTTLTITGQQTVYTAVVDTDICD
ncbi:MAG TPA: hypothetical protein VJ915_06575 [Balneolaceae bacterium]|nr:hypothetical protein [Balneolaceae bacterium]